MKIADMQREAYGLTEMQWKFFHAYITTHNATESARQAGYKAKTENTLAVQGSVNLTLPKIQAALTDWRAGQQTRRQIDIDHITDQLITVRDRALEAGDLAVARGCVTDLAKLHGLMLERRVQHSGSVSISHERISASREELIAMLAQVREQQALPAPQIERVDDS